VLESNDFFVNQAVLTGETFPVEKTPGVAAGKASLAERTNSVFMGTSVRSLNLSNAVSIVLYEGLRQLGKT